MALQPPSLQGDSSRARTPPHTRRLRAIPSPCSQQVAAVCGPATPPFLRVGSPPTPHDAFAGRPHRGASSSSLQQSSAVVRVFCVGNNYNKLLKRLIKTVRWCKANLLMGEYLLLYSSVGEVFYQLKILNVLRIKRVEEIDKRRIIDKKR